MRLINAEKLRAEAIESCKFCHLNGGKYCREKCEINALTKLIDNAPTVPLPDFKEGYKQAILDGKTNFSRPQGEWIEDSGVFACSQCHTIWLYRKTDYCPNCGADMREGDAK